MNIRFRIEPIDLVVLFGRKFRVKSQDDAGYVLENIERAGLNDRLSFEDLTELLNSPDLKIERGYFTETARKIEAQHGTTGIFALVSDKERKKAIWRKCCCDAIRELHGRGDVKLTEASLNKNRGLLRTRTEELFGYAFLENSTTAPKDISTPKFYCANQLLHWLRSYKRAGYTIDGLIGKDYRSGNRSQRFTDEEEGLVAIAVECFANTQKPHKSEAIDQARRAAWKENKRREEQDQPKLNIPSASTMNRRLNQLGPYYLFAKRNGIDAANREFAFREQGLDVKVPLERVEGDENKLDIIGLFTLTGLIKNLPAERIKEIEKNRRQLYLFFDCATRCILSLRLAKSPSADDAIRGLRDVVRDKTHIAKAHGCQSTWAMYGRPLTIVADHGTAFTSEKFQTACEGLGIGFEHPQMCFPHLRGSNESSFRFLNHNLFSMTPGRTFHNTIVRGDYPAERLACLTDDELLGLIINVYVGAYHHRPHSGLGGETPAEAWARLAGEGLVPAPPDGHEIRAVLGRKFENRSLNKNGVTWQSIHYSSPELRDAYLHSPTRKVSIRVDLENLGWISVELGGKIFPARANWDMFDGMSFAEWDETRRELRKKHSRHAELNQAIVWAAFERIENTVKQAMLRIEGTPFHVTDEAVERNERSIRVALRMSPDIDDETPLKDLISPPEKPVDPLQRGKFIAPAKPKENPEDDEDRGGSNKPPANKRRNWRFDDE